jgi:hypothetical protein
MPAPLRLRLDQRTREAVAERYERACAPIERTNAHIVPRLRNACPHAWQTRRLPSSSAASTPARHRSDRPNPQVRPAPVRVVAPAAGAFATAPATIARMPSTHLCTGHGSIGVRLHQLDERYPNVARSVDRVCTRSGRN